MRSKMTGNGRRLHVAGNSASGVAAWRVKAGRHDVFAGKRGQCVQFVRDNQKTYAETLRVIPPSR